MSIVQIHYGVPPGSPPMPPRERWRGRGCEEDEGVLWRERARSRRAQMTESCRLSSGVSWSESESDEPAASISTAGCRSTWRERERERGGV
jgi:hypothetical protein